MTLRWLRSRGPDGSRWLRWPVRLTWSWFARGSWFQVHGWEVGSELVPEGLTSGQKIPGLRAIVGQTYHLGPLKILFGRQQTDEQRELIDTWARYQSVVALVLRGCAKDRGYDDLMREHWTLMAELGRLTNPVRKAPLAFMWGSGDAGKS